MRTDCEEGLLLTLVYGIYLSSCEEGYGCYTTQLSLKLVSHQKLNNKTTELQEKLAIVTAL